MWLVLMELLRYSLIPVQFVMLGKVPLLWLGGGTDMWAKTASICRMVGTSVVDATKFYLQLLLGLGARGLLVAVRMIN